MDEKIKPMVFWNCPLCDAMYQDQISECDCEPGARTINEVNLYPQQSIDALRAEVERLRAACDKWSERELLFGAHEDLLARAERAEAEAEALRRQVDDLENGLRVASTNLRHYGHHAAAKRAEWFIDAARKGAE